MGVKWSGLSVLLIYWKKSKNCYVDWKHIWGTSAAVNGEDTEWKSDHMLKYWYFQSLASRWEEAEESCWDCWEQCSLLGSAGYPWLQTSSSKPIFEGTISGQWYILAFVNNLSDPWVKSCSLLKLSFLLVHIHKHLTSGCFSRGLLEVAVQWL